MQIVDLEIKQRTDIKQGLLSNLESKKNDIQSKKLEIDGLTAEFSEMEKLRVSKDRILQEEAKNEGMFGISPRYVQDKLSNALVSDQSRTCLNPFMLMRELETGLMSTNRSTLLPTGLSC